MSDKVLSRLVALAPTNEIAVFCAGSNPLSPETLYLVTWLEQRGAQFSLVDAEGDSGLSPFLLEERHQRKFPILCVRGRVVGVGAVLRPLAESGQLARLIEEPVESRPPVMAASSRAVEMMRKALRTPDDVIRLFVSANLHHELGVDERRPSDVELTLGGVTIVLDRESSSRAEGVAIDWVERSEGSGFRIDNPHEPEGLREVGCEALAQLLDGPQAPLLVDARTEDEFLAGRLQVARLLDNDLLDALPHLDRRTPLAFYCENGRRSRRAAQRHVELGFKVVFVLLGGLQAWQRHFGPEH
jgi:monothiol glutaredoxin